MFETLFIISVMIFVVCFVLGIIVSMIYEDNVETAFKWYNNLISILTWSVFIMIPTGFITLWQKFLS
jgi:hypothetical protein